MHAWTITKHQHSAAEHHQETVANNLSLSPRYLGGTVGRVSQLHVDGYGFNSY